MGVGWTAYAIITEENTAIRWDDEGVALDPVSAVHHAVEALMDWAEARLYRAMNEDRVPVFHVSVDVAGKWVALDPRTQKELEQKLPIAQPAEPGFDLAREQLKQQRKAK
jgi:hypothetical protein